MPLSRCPRCEKLFDKDTTAVCSDCQEAEEEDYARVRDVVNENPVLAPSDAAKKVGVDTEVVLRMIEAGVIKMHSADEMIACGRCGAPAISHSKRLCEKCMMTMEREFNERQEDLAKRLLADKKDVSVRDLIEMKRRIQGS